MNPNTTVPTRNLCIWIIFLGVLSALSSPAVQVVSTLDDDGPGSLRQAIQNAAAGDTITFTVTGTIALTNGELLITNDLNIAGPGANQLAISGGDISRVFEIGSNAVVNISGLTISEGHARNGFNTYSCDRSSACGDPGGGIYNAGTLSLSYCTVRNNRAGKGDQWYCLTGYDGTFPGDGGSGGGVYNANIFSAIGCTFSANVTGVGGNGGSYNGNGNRVGVQGGNGGSGGGLYNLGTASLTNCTLSQNATASGGYGGAGDYPYYFNGAPGYAGTGGGIYNSSNLVVVACTLSANDGIEYGGAIYNANYSYAQLLNTIAAGNSGSTFPDLCGNFTSLGHNLVGSTSAPWAGFTNGVNGDLVGTTAQPLNPSLGNLQDNGGLTPTMALLHGSPALAAGDDALLASPYYLTNDQRGFSRGSAEQVDIGAFAFQPSSNTALIAAAGKFNSGQFQFGFSNNVPGATFSILATTNFSLPLSNWTVLGPATQIAPGCFQFSDLDTTNKPAAFYRISSP